MGRVPTTLLLAGGVAGPILFTLAFIVLGAIRPGYAPMRQFVSLLSLSDDGWTMTLTFLASGCLVIAGAVGAIVYDINQYHWRDDDWISWTRSGLMSSRWAISATRSVPLAQSARVKCTSPPKPRSW